MTTFLGAILLLSLPWNVISFTATAKMAPRRNMQIFSVQDESDRFVNSPSSKLMSRKDMLSVGAAIVTGSLLQSAAVANDSTVGLKCRKPEGGAPANCISTASVKQVDLYMPPWTYPAGMPVDEVMARLKGAVSTDMKLEVMEEKENYLKVKAIRNFAIDELEFVINPVERVITFRSQQSEGPGNPDFGGNRKRLDELKRRTQVFRSMGDAFNSADSEQQEGLFGELKSFYGLGSGKGFEETLLDE
jgi:uncharacterized protein (DUF1499 family)